jgi:hypothetical protein
MSIRKALIRAYLISRALVLILSRLTERAMVERLKLKLFLRIGKSRMIYKMIEVLTVEHCDGNALYSRQIVSLITKYFL